MGQHHAEVVPSVLRHFVALVVQRLGQAVGNRLQHGRLLDRFISQLTLRQVLGTFALALLQIVLGLAVCGQVQLEPVQAMAMV